MNKEPVVILAMVRAVILILATLGLIKFTNAEQNTIFTAISALWAALEIIITKMQRARVTPVN